MYELSKKILERVSFDRALFTKELKKALHWIKPDEKLLLKVWCLSTFGHMYKDIILEAFRNVSKM